MDVHVNLWAVLTATFSAMVIGSIWYSPKVFAPTWSKLAKIDMTGNRGDIWKPPVVTIMVMGLVIGLFGVK